MDNLYSLKNDAQHYRAISDLIITGSGTLMHDNPSLNVRKNKIIKTKGFNQPHKAVLINSSNDLTGMKFFQDKTKKIIFYHPRKKIRWSKKNVQYRNIFSKRERIKG